MWLSVAVRVLLLMPKACVAEVYSGFLVNDVPLLLGLHRTTQAPPSIDQQQPSNTGIRNVQGRKGVSRKLLLTLPCSRACGETGGEALQQKHTTLLALLACAPAQLGALSASCDLRPGACA